MNKNIFIHIHKCHSLIFGSSAMGGPYWAVEGAQQITSQLDGCQNVKPDLNQQK